MTIIKENHVFSSFTEKTIHKKINNKLKDSVLHNKQKTIRNMNVSKCIKFSIPILRPKNMNLMTGT